MLRPLHTRSFALGAALVVASWGAVAVPASADPGSGKAGQHAPSAGKSKPKAASPKAGKGKGGGSSANQGAGKGNAGKGNGGGHAGGNSGGGNAGGNGRGNGNGNAGGTGGANNGANNGGGNAGGNNAGGNSGSVGQGKRGSQGDPGGNNGTVKIAPLGELDGIPNNSPHPGCTFQVEWYGFDEGDDIVSTVGFAMQAPTQDVGLSVDGDPSVFVGGDPASGAGTETGLDGTEVYMLSFDGEPHPQQGYHVKLTVNTPRSHGNDSKTKVFWVEPCQTPADETGSDEGDDTTPGTTPGPEIGTGTDTDTGSDVTPGSSDEGSSTDTGDDIEVLGAEASASADESGAEVGAQAGTQSGTEVAPAEAGERAGVPTAVDAGENGRSALDWVRSPLPLLVIALGAVLAAAAFVTRRRTRVPAGE